MTDVSELSKSLQELQRLRAWYLKSRNMMMNRLRATVAGMSGYNSGMEKAEREKAFNEAGKRIKLIKDGKDEQIPLVLTGLMAVNAFDDQKKATEKLQIQMASELSLVPWVEHPEQRGFGILFLAIVIGESGDLSNYANPAKLWKRFGCAPFEKNGENLAGATWKSRKNGKRGEKLHKSDWEAYGYCPRRHAISFLIGQNMVKQNFLNGEASIETETQNADSSSVDGGAEHYGETEDDTDGVHPPENESRVAGPYRRRYDETKLRFQKLHPDYPKMRCHLHGITLAAKLLLKNLWIEWNGDVNSETDR